MAENLNEIIEQLLSIENKKDRLSELIMQSNNLSVPMKNAAKAVVQKLEEGKMETIDKIKGKTLLHWILSITLSL